MKKNYFILLSLLLLGGLVCSCQKEENVFISQENIKTRSGVPMVNRSFSLTILEDGEQTSVDYAVEIVNINPGQEGVTVVRRSQTPRTIPLITRVTGTDRIGVIVLPTLEYTPKISGFYDLWTPPGHPHSHEYTYSYFPYMHEGSPSNIDPVFTSYVTRPSCSWPTIHVGVYIGDDALNKVKCMLVGAKYMPRYQSSGFGNFTEVCTDLLTVGNVITSSTCSFSIQNTSNIARSYIVNFPERSIVYNLNPGQTQNLTLPLEGQNGRLYLIGVDVY